MTENFGKTAIYMRLSRDDDRAGESMSIENQRIILLKFVKEHGGTVFGEYIDDGFSGTNFDRPEVKRMLQDAQSGKIDTIVVKDLSRFGRNYIQVGQYIDYIFPAYGIRFIAIGDNIDTFDRASTAMDMMPIMNVFNEWHAANTSKKIRAVLEAKQRSGKYTSWNYPYGYRAGTDDMRTAIIDGEAAKTVRRIFELRAQGNSARKIAKILTDEKIPNPTTYFTRLNGEKWNRPCKPYWWAQTVTDILKNPVYIGYTVQHKTTSVSYKNHKTINIPEGERIVKVNSHEAIISLELWEKVQMMNSSVSRGKVDKAYRVHNLSGLLVCADCGRKLKLKTTNSKSNAYSFYCRTYIDLGKNYCSSHAISEREIEDILLSDIKSMVGSQTIDERRARENFKKAVEKNGEKNTYYYEKQKSRLAELDKLIQAVFEDRVLKNLPESTCKNLLNKYQGERFAVKQEISRLEQILHSKNVEEADEYIERLNKYVKCEELTREMCLQLINFITIGEKNQDGSREIHIYYNFKQ